MITSIFSTHSEKIPRFYTQFEAEYRKILVQNLWYFEWKALKIFWIAVCDYCDSSSYQRRKRRGRPEQSTSFSTPLCFLRGRNEHYNALSYAMLVSFITYHQSTHWLSVKTLRRLRETWNNNRFWLVVQLHSLTWPYTDLLNCILILLYSSTAREYCFN